MRAKQNGIARYVVSLLAVILFLFFKGHFLNIAVSAETDYDKVQSPLQTEPLHLELVLERVYLDGEISEEKIIEKFNSIDEFWRKYDRWQLMEIDRNRYILRKQLDDISPLLKANGYFGIANDGTLSIFNGKPGNTNIIQSFFQIDMKKLESSKRKEIFNGIRVKTKDRYVEVLETFKNFSTDEKIEK